MDNIFNQIFLSTNILRIILRICFLKKIIIIILRILNLSSLRKAVVKQKKGLYGPDNGPPNF